jgi:hypothetical protein
VAKGRKLLARADELRAAAEAGDSQAMWDYALLFLGLTAPEETARWGILPFLSQVTAAAQRPDGEQARQLITMAARAGQVQAMVVSAEWVRSSDPERARRLLEQAAGQGDASAIMVLAGLVQPDDRERAIALYTSLAERGNVTAMYELAGALPAEAAQDWLRQAAEGGLRPAQSDLAVRDFETAGTRPGRNHPPAVDPRATGVFTGRTPVTRQDRIVADCRSCQKNTVQDHFELIVGRWFGTHGPTTVGKTGTRVRFRGCSVCGCLYPVDEAARRFTQSKGREYFDPAWLR